MSARSTDDGRAVPAVVDGRALTLRMRRVNTASRDARAFLRGAADGLEEPTLESVLLVTTELVTNAVLHGDGPIDLTVTVGPARVVVEVFDCEPLHPELRAQDVTRTDGRGIALVSMVSSDWGSRRQGDGKTVWAAIDRP